MPRDVDQNVIPASAALRSLQEALSVSVDVIASYDKMVSKADLSVRPNLQDLRALHAKHAAQLSSMIRAHGGEPVETPSFLSTFNRMVVTLKHMFDTVGPESLSDIRESERVVLAALERAELDTVVTRDQRTLCQMRKELREALAQEPVPS